MTQPLEQACDSGRIDDYLNEQLAAPEQAEFEAHLSRCQWCQQQVESRAAEPELWKHAVALLGQSAKLDLGWINAPAASKEQQDDEAASGFQSRQVQSVLESLSPTEDPEMLGRIDDYEIIGVVGVGGMGAVLKGFDKSLRRVVAVKIMAPHLAGSGSARLRFQREARAAAAITHDNVIDIYSVSEAGGLPYLVMPYARGPSLQKRIDQGGPLSIAEVLRIGRQIAAGLTAAHEQGLVHRDIKPSNILLNDGIERLLITDFGVARAMDDASMTRTGVIAGTPQYMSPEQARGEAVDYRSDLFSLGSVLYTACTGRPPFRSEAAYGILRRITDDDPRPIREINPDIPDWLCRIINRLMAKHPADRFQNAAELVDLFEGCLAHLQRPTHVVLPQSLAPSTSTAPASPPHAQRVRGGVGSGSFFSRTGVWLMVSLLLLAAMGFITLQMTAPVDIAGSWQGDTWESVSLSSVDEAANWYKGAFTDADGKQGALQLEWSRLQRRYNGRWKVGDTQSGSITLREGDGGGVRGAVSVDADSSIAADAPRLWEFAWKRAAGTKKSAGGVVIESPVKGVIRWSKGIGEGTVVKQGDRIAEIRPIDSSEQKRLREQLASAKQHAADTAERHMSCERNLEAMRSIVEATQDQIRTYETVKQRVAEAGETAVASALITAHARKQLIGANRAELAQLRAEHEQMNGQLEKGLISQAKFFQVEQKLKAAEANVGESSAMLEAVENEVADKQNEAETQETRAQADIDSAKVELAKAVADVVRAESEIAKAQAELANTQKRIEDLNTALTQQEMLLINAPFDGRVTDLTRAQLFKEGDLVCTLIPWPSEPVPNAADSEQSVSQTQNPPGPVTPPLPAPTTQDATANNPIAQTFGPVSDLVRRLREGSDKIESLERELESQTAKLDEITKNQSTIEKEIADAKEKAKADDPEEVRRMEERLAALYSNREAINNARAARLVGESLMRRTLEAAKKQLADAEAERATIVRLLQSQLTVAQRQLVAQKEFTDNTRQGFALGDPDVNDILKAEQDLAELKAKVQQLAILLQMYQSLGTDPESSEP